MAIGLLRHSCLLCGFDHHFRAHVDGHGVNTGRGAEPRLFGDGYGIWGHPYGWMVYVYFMENPKQKWIVHHFHICSLDWLKGKMKPENPISHGENHGFQLSESLQQSEQIWKL